jgi:hypothetical protein
MTNKQQLVFGIIYLLMWSSINSPIYTATQAYIKSYIDLGFFPFMNLSTNYVLNGNMSASSNGSSIIEAGKNSTVVSGNSLRNWLA